MVLNPDHIFKKITHKTLRNNKGGRKGGYLGTHSLKADDMGFTYIYVYINYR